MKPLASTLLHLHLYIYLYTQTPAVLDVVVRAAVGAFLRFAQCSVDPDHVLCSCGWFMWSIGTDGWQLAEVVLSSGSCSTQDSESDEVAGEYTGIR